jgi:hypothetical protein
MTTDTMPDLRALIDQELRNAWVAGVLDAAGRWVVLDRANSPSISPRILVPARADSAMIDLLIETFGGSVGKPKGWQRQWQVTGAKACLAVNQAVLPYLTRTERLAKTHLHLCRQIAEWRPKAFDDRSVPADELKLRRELRDAFERVKHATVGASPTARGARTPFP